MKSNQINLFITMEDVLEIEKYLSKQSIVFLMQPMPSQQPIIKNSLQNILLKEYRPDIILSKKEHLSFLQFRHIEKQNHYLIDITSSPVIEFWFPFNYHSQEKLHASRFYYTKDTFHKTNLTETLKPSGFLQSAEDLFRWIKKTFKNAKLPGYEGYLVSPRAAEWSAITHGKLVKG
jgi:hypothetical protein